eukprot:Skav213120  [mRNA]  locus=scaffold107:89262:90458:+ [translate_table: standard]
MADISEVMHALEMKSYGILGMSSEGTDVEPPDEITVLVDLAGLLFIQDKGPAAAEGDATAIYKWLEISEDESFPEDVRQAITEECHAKYHSYADDKKKCIHVVGPDFRKIDDPDFTEDNAVDKLAVAYRNVFEEFCKVGAEHGLKNMRLLPISGGIFSGRFKENLPEITVRAVQAAYERLAEDKKQYIMGSSIEMCIFKKSEFDMFASAFEQSHSQSYSQASEDSTAEAGIIAVAEQHDTAHGTSSEIAIAGRGIKALLDWLCKLRDVFWRWLGGLFGSSVTAVPTQSALVPAEAAEPSLGEAPPPEEPWTGAFHDSFVEETKGEAPATPAADELMTTSSTIPETVEAFPEGPKPLMPSAPRRLVYLGSRCSTCGASHGLQQWWEIRCHVRSIAAQRR